MALDSHELRHQAVSAGEDTHGPHGHNHSLLHDGFALAEDDFMALNLPPATASAIEALDGRGMDVFNDAWLSDAQQHAHHDAWPKPGTWGSGGHALGMSPNLVASAEPPLFENLGTTVVASSGVPVATGFLQSGGAKGVEAGAVAVYGDGGSSALLMEHSQHYHRKASPTVTSVHQAPPGVLWTSLGGPGSHGHAFPSPFSAKSDALGGVYPQIIDTPGPYAVASACDVAVHGAHEMDPMYRIIDESAEAFATVQKRQAAEKAPAPGHARIKRSSSGGAHHSKRSSKSHKRSSASDLSVATGKEVDNAAKNRSSRFRGVTKHRRSGRWEAHIWIKEIGRQVYLGGYEQEEHAAEAYDVAALKCKGRKVKTNFDTPRYHELLNCMDSISLEELIMAVRRQSQGFSRGSSSYRGVTAHPSGRWESRIGIPGSKHIYLGLYEDEKDAAKAYDKALVRLRGTAAATNFGLSDYRQELAEYHQMQQAVLLGDKKMESVMQSGPDFERWIKLGVQGLENVLDGDLGLFGENLEAVGTSLLAEVQASEALPVPKAEAQENTA